jgi:hypothetical protein
VSCIAAPGRPSGRPGFRPDFPRSDFGRGSASPSEDGGFEDFREFPFTLAVRSATLSTWNGSPQRELTTNPLSGMFGADQRCIRSWLHHGPMLVAMTGGGDVLPAVEPFSS